MYQNPTYSRKIITFSSTTISKDTFQYHQITHEILTIYQSKVKTLPFLTSTTNVYFLFKCWLRGLKWYKFKHNLQNIKCKKKVTQLVLYSVPNVNVWCISSLRLSSHCSLYCQHCYPLETKYINHVLCTLLVV